MTKRLTLIALIGLAALAGCADTTDDPVESLSSTQQSIRNGTASDDESVIRLRIAGDNGRPDGRCSGTMIRPNVALTAAHCVDFPVSRLSSTALDGSVRPVASVMIHHDTDIALVRFYQDLGRPTRVLADRFVDAGETVRMLGFGQTENRNDPVARREGTAQALGYNSIPVAFDSDGTTGELPLVLGSIPTSSSTCPGDSGGPILAVARPDFQGPVPGMDFEAIVAITSAGNAANCAEVSRTFHANITFYRPWIDRALTVMDSLSGGENICPPEMPMILIDEGQPFRGSREAECILGTPGDDNIRGGGGDDIIFGFGGDDRLYGGAGDDLIYGGEGRDIIFGNTERDTLLGGPGNDRLSACSGDNTGCADGGRELLDGGTGSDELHIMGADIALGGPGNDEIYATGNTHQAEVRGHIVGDSGNDLIVLNGRGFRVCGGPGRDRIRGNQASRNHFFAGRDDDFSSFVPDPASLMPESCHGFGNTVNAPYTVSYDFDEDGRAGAHGWDNSHCICEPLPVLEGPDLTPIVGPLPPNHAPPTIRVQRMPPLAPTGDCDDADPSITTCD